MKSITYICPTGNNKPTGGIKVIYRHVETISKLLPKGIESKVFHFEDFNFSCNWFSHKVNFKKILFLIPIKNLLLYLNGWQCIMQKYSKN